MPDSAQNIADAPGDLAGVMPAALPRAQLVTGGRSHAWITDKVCGIAEQRTPSWWWWCFGVAAFLASFTVAGLAYLVATGVGVWGHRNPENWAWDVVNFVFWIGIGHAGTLISAILLLLRQTPAAAASDPAPQSGEKSGQQADPHSQGSINGTVLDATGAAVSGVHVKLTREDQSPARKCFPTTTTNSLSRV